MHLLAAQSGVIDDGSEAIDLAQEPGDVVVLSAADTELAALALARDRLAAGPSLRLANLMQLSHNMSVDVYVENTLAGARLVVLRLLGGASYWPYGLDQVAQCCRDNRIGLAVLPGDSRPDPDLAARSTLPPSDCDALWRYLIEGGPENAANFLSYCFHLLGEGEPPPAARPLVKAGLYWPERPSPSLDDIRQEWAEGQPVAPIVFYRALLEAGNTAPVDALAEALAEQGLNPLPLFVSSLKEKVSAATVRALLAEVRPAVILNATGFAVAGSGDNPLGQGDCPVLQVVFAGSSREGWIDNPQGLSARDLAMNVVLPELDGRILSRAVSFKSQAEHHAATQCNIVTYRPEPDRIAFVARLAANWARLGATPAAERRLAIVLANYPNRDGRIGNGVGYDTPASTVAILDALRGAGYGVEGYPSDGTALIKRLMEGPTNSAGARRDRLPDEVRRPEAASRPHPTGEPDRGLRRNDGRDASPAVLPLDAYRAAFAGLPQTVQSEIDARWGAPEDDPFFRGGSFHLPVITFGNVAVAIQPARGYQIDPKETYHDPALVPPHGYLAFHVWLREAFGAQAIVHNGKHGNLEWLPGKALALTEACYPEAALQALPNIYPFIVNDPGEGSQAKRRTSAVIVDHLTPPLTRAESYGPLKDLEALVDEYYLASGLDARRTALLKREILELTRVSGLDADAGIADCADEDQALMRLDAYICELKEAQIRDGLHVLGTAPEGRLETDLLVALARVPRGLGEGGDASLIRALAADLGIAGFDPLDCDMAAPWQGARPAALADILPPPWRTAGDAVERLEALAAALIAGRRDAPGDWPRTRAVLERIEAEIRPALRDSGPREIAAVRAALDGRFVEPGPSGAPSRGRIDVLPTGRNFYSIDSRALPTPAAWSLGEASAGKLVARHLEDHGNWPRALGLSAWGTSNMRTGGDDIAQALALIGAKPVWDTASWRVTGFEIVPLARLGRPRVDVTLRVSGFFRDAFPAQIDLFDSAVSAIGALDEDAAENPIAERMKAEAAGLEAAGVPAEEARRRAGFRVFGSKPGAYGAGLQALIDEQLWNSPADLAESYLNWGGYAYGSGAGGAAEHATFRRRLAGVEAVVHNQDNREHDLLDSDDYYQFEGGMTAAVAHLSGARPAVYHNDHSRPERPVIRTLEEEIGRVVRARVVNPKWIAGVMRHGYKGAFEIVATVDYMFAFAATTGAVRSHHFELAYEAFIADDAVRAFIGDTNPAGLGELAERFREAIERGLWSPRSNAAPGELARLCGAAHREDVT